MGTVTDIAEILCKPSVVKGTTARTKRIPLQHRNFITGQVHDQSDGVFCDIWKIAYIIIIVRKLYKKLQLSIEYAECTNPDIIIVKMNENGFFWLILENNY